MSSLKLVLAAQCAFRGFGYFAHIYDFFWSPQNAKELKANKAANKNLQGTQSKARAWHSPGKCGA